MWIWIQLEAPWLRSKQAVIMGKNCHVSTRNPELLVFVLRVCALWDNYTSPSVDVVPVAPIVPTLAKTILPSRSSAFAFGELATRLLTPAQRREFESLSLRQRPFTPGTNFINRSHRDAMVDSRPVYLRFRPLESASRAGFREEEESGLRGPLSRKSQHHRFSRMHLRHMEFCA